jgi:hypothetical protein
MATVKVLIVDDRPDEVSALVRALKARKLKADVREPEEVELHDLQGANLVLVDLDLKHWNGNLSSAPIAIRPSDGLALAGVFRRHLVNSQDYPPTGFAMLTGQVEQMAHPFAPDNRLHLIAHMNNLDCIFLKKDPDLARKVTSLARAIRSVPKDWCDGIQSVQEISEALGFNEKILPLERYEEVVQACHPPIYELTQWSHGLAFIRWLLQKVLVYPCFLWDSHRLAARLRIEVSEVEKILASKSKLRTQLSSRQYKGILSDFNGVRWWRAAIELFLWEITDGDSQNNAKLVAALENLAGRPLQPASVERPYVCIDKDYRPLDDFLPMSEIVRVQPDDWPGYADSAFMPIEVVRSDRALSALVAPEDKPKLEPATNG